MDFIRRRLSQGGSSDEENSRSSISEGTSRFYNAVVAKKNGLLSNLSSKIENVGATLMKTSSSSYDSSSGGEDSPPYIPTPSSEKSRDYLFPDADIKSETSSVFQSNVQVEYGRPRHESSSGYSDSSGGHDDDSGLPVSNVNMSFEEPLYSPSTKQSNFDAQYEQQFIEKSVNEMNEKRNVPNKNGNNHRVIADVHVDQSNIIESGRKLISAEGTRKSPGSSGLSSPESVGSAASSHSSHGGQIKKSSTRQKAPMLTTTKRRSSTIDEMLFDDYVVPEEEVQDITQESLDKVGKLDQINAKNKRSLVPMGDLISFDDDQESSDSNKHSRPGEEKFNVRHSGKELHKTSAFASVSSVDSSDFGNYRQTSGESSDNDFGGYQVRHRTGSMGSENSWSSSYSIESQPDDVTLECMEFMKQFVEKIFNTETEISQTEKAKFGELCQYAPGRLWFARYVNSQRVHNKCVAEQIFFRLVQYFAVVLFECNEAEDFSPAKSLMNMCFTFFYESFHANVRYRNFLYSFLREQPIWQSLRFWNAAFFDAVQCERSRQPMCTSGDADQAQTDDKQFQENITFGQLGCVLSTFTCNMRAFGLGKDLCLEFLRKQSTIANLREEQIQMLRDNVEKWKDL